MNIPKLFYDADCFICSNYVRLLKLQIPVEKLDYERIKENSNDFAYQSIDGTMYYGHDGIDKLIVEVPETLALFEMVPYWIRNKTAHVMYSVSGTLRQVIRRVGGKCCGR